MILSGGVVVKGTQRTVWTGTPATWPGWGAIGLGNRWASYAQMYQEQVWVGTVIDKLAWGLARLPLKVYERAEKGRPEARNHPYAALLRKPNDRQWPMLFWLWASSTYDIYGECFHLKQRDRGGRPVQLLPLHPTGMREVEERDGEVWWEFQNGTLRIENIRNSELLHPRNYNPTSTTRGLSKLERLRRTLEFEDAAQRAQSAFWRKGARPGTALTHPGNPSQAAQERLKLQWDAIAAGADNTGVTVVLEEGMKAEKLTLSAEEAQYIASRQLNREEVVAAFDMPPPAVHILDHATFANITEQFRSVYRDTQAPRCKMFEGALELELRGSVRPGSDDPDFGEEVYAEFLMDEVLRGDFETRIDAMTKAVQSGLMTPAEGRELENMPFIAGSDRLLVNSTMVPLQVDDEDAKVQAAFAGEIGQATQRLGLGVRYGVLSADEARQFVPGVTGPAPEPPENAPALPVETVRSLMGRLSRQKTLDDVDPAALTAGFNGHAERVLIELEAAKASGDGIAAFRRRIAALATEEADA